MQSAKSEGFTFLEVLIALTILAVAGLGVLRLIQDGQDSLGHTRLVHEAEVLALAQLEELEKDGLSAILDREGGDDDSALQWKARAFTTQTEGFYRLEIRVFEHGADGALFRLEKMFIERF